MAGTNGLLSPGESEGITTTPTGACDASGPLVSLATSPDGEAAGGSRGPGSTDCWGDGSVEGAGSVLGSGLSVGVGGSVGRGVAVGVDVGVMVAVGVGTGGAVTM